jgi:hypothetical protein
MAPILLHFAAHPLALLNPADRDQEIRENADDKKGGACVIARFFRDAPEKARST